MGTRKNNIIYNWLDKNGSPEIEKMVGSNMEARELRLGNWVTTTERGCECDYQVIGIGEDFVDLYHPYKCDPFKEAYGVEIPSLRPIPLTEEWLDKFGFEKSDDLGSYEVGLNSPFVALIWNSEEVDLENDFSIEPMTITYRCKYVHQLQNLYFALTGKELTPKE